MEIRPNIIVALGYGKYVRSDKIAGLEPIDEREKRGPGRRTRVFVEDRAEPVVASRTEATILRDMVQVPSEIIEARGAVDLLEDIMQDLSEVGPMLRRSIREEAGLDIDAIIRRIRGVVTHETED